MVLLSMFCGYCLPVHMCLIWVYRCLKNIPVETPVIITWLSQSGVTGAKTCGILKVENAHIGVPFSDCPQSSNFSGGSLLTAQQLELL